jgi:chromosomal replication initiation ATPase DnaA
VDLDTLERGIAEEYGVAGMSLQGGGRTRALSEARAILCYVWVKYLGRSDRELAREFGLSPWGICWACRKLETGSKISAEAMDRWC